LKLLEEEKQKLKKEIDDIWKALEEKENTIQQQNHEMKKLSEFKKQAEKYKSDKTLLNEEIKRITIQSTQLNTSLNESRAEREEEKMKYEKLLKDLETKNQEKLSSANNQTIKEFVESAKLQLDQMQKKLDFYKEKSEGVDILKAKLAEKEKEYIRLKTDHGSELNTLRYKLSEEYEEKLEQWETKYNADIKALNEKHAHEMKSFDLRLLEVTNTHAKSPDLNNLTINTLRAQKEYSDKYANELKAQTIDQQKIITENKSIIQELKAQIEDLKMRMELHKKTYKKT